MKKGKLTKEQILDLRVKALTEAMPPQEGFHYEHEFNSVYGGYRVVNVKDGNGGHYSWFGGSGTEPRVKFDIIIMKIDTIIATANELKRLAKVA